MAEGEGEVEETVAVIDSSLCKLCRLVSGRCGIM